jgi:hypothetical protein
MEQEVEDRRAFRLGHADKTGGVGQTPPKLVVWRGSLMMAMTWRCAAIGSAKG